MAASISNWPDIEGLDDWLECLGIGAISSVDMQGDVSARRYKRLTLEGGQSFVLAIYPEELSHACRAFETTTRILTEAGVRVPKIMSGDVAFRFTLIEDVGTRTVYDLCGDEAAELAPYFEEAAQIAERINRLPLSEVDLLNPPLGESLLRAELEATWRVLLEPALASCKSQVRSTVQVQLSRLCTRLGNESPLVCHRDFMVRNLVLHGPAPGLVVLDHQDLRPGPPFYDLASLLNDSLFPPTWLEERILAGRLRSSVDRIRYHRVAAQRTLKAAGTYESFARRGTPRYRHLIAPTFERAVSHLARVPETLETARLLRALPVGEGLVD